MFLWRCMTGENYPVVMWDLIKALKSEYIILYFTSFVSICDWLIINLFLSIVLNFYEEYSEDPENPVKVFTRDVKVFRKI